MDVFAEYSFRVRSYECGPDGRVTLATVCNYLQEVASMHAGELGFSKENFEERGENISWVLTRLRVKMTRYPHWREEVVVETCPRPGRRITALRDFTLRVGGETVGIATSEWMIINLATRKVVPVPEFFYAASNDVRAPIMGDEPFSRLRWSDGEAGGELRLRARRGDIDLNGHVNNVHYVEWLVEALPEGAGEVADFEIAFKSETLAGEEVRAAAVRSEDGAWMAHVAADDGKDHVVARLVM